MVQINLPDNSKVKKGKYYKDKTGSKNLRKVNVYRWDPSTGENPRIDTYEVDMNNCPCLLYTSPSPRDISGSRMPSSA